MKIDNTKLLYADLIWQTASVFTQYAVKVHVLASVGCHLESGMALIVIGISMTVHKFLIILSQLLAGHVYGSTLCSLSKRVVLGPRI